MKVVHEMVEATGRHIREMSVTRCLVLGGGGFIGSAIVEELLARDYAIRVFERPRVTPFLDISNSPAVEWMVGDFQNKKHLEQALQNIDVVIHLISATLPHDSFDNSVYDVQLNLVASLQLLDAMVRQKVHRIIFVSSGGTVYGIPEELPITEKHPTNPLVSYGITKLAIEKYLLLYQRQHSIRPTILRVANPYGIRQRPETNQGIIAVFFDRILRGKAITVYGDGSNIRDYLYVSDVAQAFVKAIEYAGPHTVFNIASGTGTSINQLIESMEVVLGRSIARCNVANRTFDVKANVLDISRANEALAWKPTVSLAEGLSRTFAHLKDSRQ